MSTNTELLEREVADLATEKLSRTRIFERYGIDYCCGGHVPLGAACAARGVDATRLVDELLLEDAAGRSNPAREPLALSDFELVRQIEDTHHRYLREELPALERLLERVTEKHGHRNPMWRAMLAVYQELLVELLQHLENEELHIFPLDDRAALKHLSPADALVALSWLTHLEGEHRATGQALERLSELSSGFTTPENACPSQQAAMERLRRLDEDLKLHIHKENNILFARLRRALQELIG
jgi:regulator of cell morphogenesis and NO signaling